jgi:hypothetical protein
MEENGEGSVKYKALISSDWNECLAPCGPFDPVSFAFPDLEPELRSLFRQYTGNEISLAEATRRIAALTPRPVTTEDMDAYLDASFSTYRGVPELIDWCLSRDILFMINRTRVVVVGDSGGDGPHFEWGSSLGAFLIGSMTKGSLESYCSKRGITVHERFGISYASGETRVVEKELSVNFMELTYLIEVFLSLAAPNEEKPQ